MDSINQQLYPADPFSSLNDEFSAGEHAFAEAAQYLFPETVSAPLEWLEEDYGGSEILALDDEGIPVLDLGPSYVPQALGFRPMPNQSEFDFSVQPEVAFYTEPVAPAPEAFVGNRQTLEEVPAFSVSADPPGTPSQALEAWDSTDTVDFAQTLSMPTAPPMAVYEPSSPLLESDPFLTASALAQSQVVPSVAAIQEHDFYATAFTLNEAGELVPLNDEDLLIELSPLPQPQAELDAVAEDIELTPAAAAHWGQDLTQAFSKLAEPPFASSQSEFVQSEGPVHQAFYAGLVGLPPQLVEAVEMPAASPGFPEPLTPIEEQVSSRSSAFEQSIAWQDLIAPYVAYPVNVPQPQKQAAAAQPPQAAVEIAIEHEQESPLLEAELPPQKRIIHPKPLNRKMPDLNLQSIATPAPLAVVPISPSVRPLVSIPEVTVVAENSLQDGELTSHVDSFDAAVGLPAVQEAGVEPNAPAAPQVSDIVAASMPMAAKPVLPEISQKLALGNLEVMGLCQLSPDKRLMLVQSDGVYALMAQSGPGQTDVTVLKVFEQNPLAFQHTFTAIEEGKAWGKGMFVAQVGTWRAILSTFQDKIILHTELG